MKRKILCTVLASLTLCSIAACGVTSNIQPESERISSTTPQYSAPSVSNEISTIQNDTAAELPGGNIDYSAYEPYGLFYDPQNGCYTYNGSVVRHFNDPVAGASFTNYFTGTVDLEAEYDTNNTLVGIKECSGEVYARHDQKKNEFSTDMKTDVAIQTGTQSYVSDVLKDYEVYGVSYNAENSGWYYNDKRIKILIDSEIASVYLTDENGIYLSVVRNEDHTIAEIKEITEAAAKILMQENNPQDKINFAIEE